MHFLLYYQRICLWDTKRNSLKRIITAHGIASLVISIESIFNHENLITPSSLLLLFYFDLQMYQLIKIETNYPSNVFLFIIF